jgi:hypothetical protein
MMTAMMTHEDLPPYCALAVRCAFLAQSRQQLTVNNGSPTRGSLPVVPLRWHHFWPSWSSFQGETTGAARKAYALMKAGAVKGLSIGYQIVHDGLQNGVRVLQELKLHEVSVVTFAMNPRAQVMAVKEEIQPCAAKGLVKYL